MPKITCTLERGGKDRLEVAWKGQWKNTTVTLDDAVLGTFADAHELKEGKAFVLNDGTTLHFQLVKNVVNSELKILRDGEPLPGSASDPFTRYKLAYGILFGIAILNIVLGLLSVLCQSEFLQNLGIGFSSILYGVGFIILGYFTKRRSAIALILAIVIFISDSLMTIVLWVVSGTLPNTAGIIGRIFLLIPMIQGVKAIRELPTE